MWNADEDSPTEENGLGFILPASVGWTVSSPPSQCVQVNCGLLHSINLIFKCDSYHKVLRALWLGFCHAPKTSKDFFSSPSKEVYVFQFFG